VYLIPDVNASVFYNSSFWSMFFPVKKNLQIGLGLLNSVNVGELKAVLAHEFGHFSQKSMSIGSYVYTANNIIYNLVYEYDKWDQMLDEWRAQSSIWGFFGMLTHGIVSLVRSMLRGAYTLINVRYMGLSREMEFHADLIAASIAGSQNMVSALRRVEFTDAAYGHTIGFLNTLLDRKQYTTNIYPLHSAVIKRQIKQLELKAEGNLPVITADDLDKHTPKSRVNYKDQWASHPSLAEREASLQQSPPNEYIDTQSAWTLLQNPESLQSKQSQMLYDLPAEAVKECEEVSVGDFIKLLDEEESKNRVASEYKGYYSQHVLTAFDLEQAIANEAEMAAVAKLDMSDLFNDDITKRAEVLSYNENDVATLVSIQDKEINAKYFEFDNQKYHRKNIREVLNPLRQSVKEETKWFKAHDQKAFLFFYAKAGDKQDELKQQYLEVFAAQQSIEKLGELLVRIQRLYNEISQKVSWDEEFEMLNKELNTLEIDFKRFLKSEDGLRVPELIADEDQVKERLQHYLDEHIALMSHGNFNGENFAILYQLIQDTYIGVTPGYSRLLKQLTSFQLDLLA
jgi:Zn-dependent protease with chaperone function